MEWTGNGLLIGLRRYGEASVIAEAMVEGRGRHLGMVRNGRSPRQAATLQPGNTVQLTWRARLEDHLGTFSVELLHARAANLMAERRSLYASQVICEHLRLLPERDPHDFLLMNACDLLDGDLSGPALARFELSLLEELGFGLDLTTCAATGVHENLTHVSPRSGRAVCAEAAEPYLDRLLPLPQFLLDEEKPASWKDLSDAFRLTGHFLDMHVWQARRLDPPPMRDALVALLLTEADEKP